MESRTHSGADDAVGTPSTTETCFCCGKPYRSQCLSDDCPRAIIAASLAIPHVTSDLSEQGTPQSRPQTQADISPNWPGQAWIQSYFADDNHGHNSKFIRFIRKFIRQHNQEPTQQRAPSLSAASQLSEDSQVKPKSTHADGKQAEATQFEPPPPSEVPTGMSLPNQALSVLLRLRAFFELCPLDTLTRLACTCTTWVDPAVAAQLTLRTETLHRLRTGLNNHPSRSPRGHHDRQQDEAESRQQQKKRGIVACKRSKEGGTWREPRQPEKLPPSIASSSTDAIQFFSKRGKQQHNRSGFYWGAPGKTASTKENSTAVQCSSGHPANTDATAEDPLDRQEHRSGTCKTTTTEDFMDQAAEQTFQRQADATTSSQASRSDSSAPVDDTISTCMQCEFGPGTEGPLGLFCRKCALELSESGIQIYRHA
jgi:hypothetical protein